MKKMLLITAAIFALAGCGKSNEVEKEKVVSTEQTQESASKENNTNTGASEQKEPQNSEIKQQVTDELARIEEQTADYAKLLEANEAPTPELQVAAEQLNNNWESALLVVSSLIGPTLDDSKNEELTKEITEFNQSVQVKAEEEAAQYKDTTSYGVQLLSSLAKSYKEKSYELVEKYLQ